MKKNKEYLDESGKYIFKVQQYLTWYNVLDKHSHWKNKCNTQKKI